MPTPRELLADLLKTSRLESGYESHAALAAEMNVSRPVISKAESAINPVPSDSVLVGWSGKTGVPIDKLRDLANRAKSGTPEWFVPYKQAEAEATMIRCHAPMIVPGLKQTEGYARAVLSAFPYTPARLEELVSARMERQAVLQRAYVVSLIGAEVLNRCMGDAAIMAEQCAHLVALAELPNVTVHIVPENTNHGAWGALDIASRDGLATVNFSTTTEDVSTNATDRAEQAIQTWERILGYALSVPASLEHVRTMEAQWKQQI